MTGSSIDDTAARVPQARRRFVAATVILAVGSGLWMPFALLFLVHAQGLSLVAAGAALSLGGLIGLVSVPFLGSLIDRVGLLAMMVTCNLVRVAAFACYPLATEMWQVSVVSAVIVMGDRLFWTANTPMINALTPGRKGESLLATQTVARFVGAGIGSGMAAVLPTVATVAYHALAYVNAASLAIAALLIASLRRLPALSATHAGSGRDAHRSTGSWIALLRNRAYVGLCATHILFTLASVSKYLILPIVVFDILDGPRWIPGTAVVIGTLVIVIGQQPITRYCMRCERPWALAVAGAIFAVSFAALAPLTWLPVSASTVILVVYAATVSVAEAIFAPVATAAAADAAPRNMQGRASGLFQLSWGVSHVIAPTFLTALLAVHNAVLWLMLAGICALSVGAVWMLRGILTANPADGDRHAAMPTPRS